MDISTVDWVFVGLMAVFAFIAALLGNLIALRNSFVGAIIAAVLFVVMFVVWNYYPHPTVPLPIVTSYSYPKG